MGASKLMMSNKKLFLKKILMELDEDINDSEYNILNDLIDNIDIIQKYSIREAAKNNFISTASISRLCYKFGLSGYSELKFFLKSEYEKFIEKTYNDNLSLKNKLYLIINSFEDNYKKTIDYINENELKEFLKLIYENKGISVCGSGLSEVMAMYFFQRFQMAGKRVNFINLNAPSEIYVNQLKESSSIIVFSKSGNMQNISNKLNIARKNNVKVILITSQKKSKILDEADITIEIYGNNKSRDKNDKISSYNSNVIILIDILVELYIENIKEQAID
jgi:RpiR family transcriptional regulator, carbohydrate utilization regulator